MLDSGVQKSDSVVCVCICVCVCVYGGFPGGAVVKNSPVNTGASGDADSIPESERSPGGGNGNPLQYSCQDNLMDRGAWRATAHGVAKSWT